MEALIEEHGLTGAGLIVVDEDQGILYHDHWKNFNEERVSLIASASKIITAGVLLHLNDAGVLDIDAPISDVIDYAGVLGNITAAQLLSNSSGLVGLEINYLYLCNFLSSGTIQQCAKSILANAAIDPRTVEPDTEFRYGGPQWQVAGAVAEAASGKSWHELVNDIYTEPCGMKHFGYSNPFGEFAFSDFAYPDWDGDLSVLKYTDNPNLGAGAYITTGDYGKLLQMHLNGGMCDTNQVLSPEAVVALQENRTGRMYNSSVNYGMGWWIDTEPAGIAESTTRVSSPGIFGAISWLQPETGFGAYLVIEDKSSTRQAFTKQLFDLIETAVLSQREE
ncbi:MAG: CubicO group peptidase (beta-lactamase class C family) [Candidatus Poriferisodalaceae bacterium]|jgi:CubicO group peptidase (beta-lactamase class C family)|tara:strand:- start:3875 stop:4879 length:1005 start_codon:yes stop_codon:yes gene_type:complete